MPPARFDSRAHRRAARQHLVVRGAAPPVGGAETVADLHPLHRLDAHQRPGQPRVEAAVGLDVGAEPDRQAVGDHLDHAAEGVAVVVRGVDLGHHRRGRRLGERADRAGVDPLQVVRPRHRVVVRGVDRRRSPRRATRSRPPAPAAGTPSPRCRARPATPSPARWPARAPAGRRRTRTSSCRPGRRGPAAGGSAARCARGSAMSAGSTGSAAITVSHFGHSVLPIRTATGPPCVLPCRMPPITSSSSASNAIRGLRPCPSLRRASSAVSSFVVISTPATMPSSTATSAGPWDSPAVIQRSTPPSSPGPRAGGSPRCRPGRPPTPTSGGSTRLTAPCTAAVTSSPARSIDGPCGTAPRGRRATSTAAASAPLNSAASSAATTSASHEAAASAAPSGAASFTSPAPSAAAAARCTTRCADDGHRRPRPRPADRRSRRPAAGAAGPRQRRQGQRVGQPLVPHVDGAGGDREPSEGEQHGHPAGGHHADPRGGADAGPRQRDPELAPRWRHAAPRRSRPSSTRAPPPASSPAANSDESEIRGSIEVMPPCSGRGHRAHQRSRRTVDSRIRMWTTARPRLVAAAAGSSMTTAKIRSSLAGYVTPPLLGLGGAALLDAGEILALLWAAAGLWNGRRTDGAVGSAASRGWSRDGANPMRIGT